MPNHDHLRDEANILDLDDGISWPCTACKLPIFATPFTSGGAVPLLHDQCAQLPAVLNYCELHPKQPLFLRDNNNDETCSECSQKCGSKLYHCQDSGCGLVLDVACALPVKVLHRSHHHRLVAVRGAGRICGVCSVAHKTTASSAEARSYSCIVCGFWIHPDCATSPNVIEHEKNVHPLVLYYDVAETFGVQYSTPIDVHYFLSSDSEAPPQKKDNDRRCSSCAICRNDVGTRVGIYACIKCRDCIFHIYCATSDPPTFKPAVSSREARFPSLVRLPMADEHQSIVGCIREASSSDNDHKQNNVERAHTTFEHELHPFILHTKCDEDGTGVGVGVGVCVCDACLKIIDKPPFYCSSKCPNVLLHDYCYLLPRFVSANPAHTPGHYLYFILSDDPIHLRMFMNESTCRHCSCPCIRAFYKCFRCEDQTNYSLDISCTLMPEVITHEAHSTTHFLRLSSESSSRRSHDCACCLQLLGVLAYECRTCQNFALHTWCAMLPKTVTHKFDPHPLRLTTNAYACVPDICEICEDLIQEKVWRYNCERCDQSFHIDCIPCLDMMYKIKSLVSEGVQLPNVPNRLLRGLTLQGHGHGDEYCRDVADEYDDILASD